MWILGITTEESLNLKQSSIQRPETISLNSLGDNKKELTKANQSTQFKLELPFT